MKTFVFVVYRKSNLEIEHIFTNEKDCEDYVFKYCLLDSDYHYKAINISDYLKKCLEEPTWCGATKKEWDHLYNDLASCEDDDNRVDVSEYCEIVYYDI